MLSVIAAMNCAYVHNCVVPVASVLHSSRRHGAAVMVYAQKLSSITFGHQALRAFAGYVMAVGVQVHQLHQYAL